jgi:FtsZ-binding cell division protein ZapB
MISLEQVRQLDIRVKKAVSAVKVLSAENSALKQQIAELEARLAELRREASDRQANEQQIEVGLQGVLDVLDEVDGETADVEPEPPAENYIIETVQDESEEPAAALDVSDDVSKSAELVDVTGNGDAAESRTDSEQPELDVELPPDSDVNDEPDDSVAEDETDEPADSVAEDETDEPADSAGEDEAEKSDDSNAEDDDGLKPRISVDGTDQESSEDVDLEKDDQDLSGGDEDRFQSEFDIF